MSTTTNLGITHIEEAQSAKEISINAALDILDARAVDKNTIDQKGDLIVGTGANALARLAVGSNNQVPKAASGEATGVLWGWVGLGDGSDGSRAGSLDAFTQVVADTGSADTEFTVAHGLGRTPVGFIVVRIDRAGIVYDSGSAWDGTNIKLKCSAANAAVTLIIF